MLLLRTDRALISAMSSSLGSGAPSLNLIARSVRALKWWSVPCSRQQQPVLCQPQAYAKSVDPR